MRVRPAAPEWEEWHRFAVMGLRPAGHRVRVLADAAAPPAPVEEDLTRDTPTASFPAVLPSGGADLRLVDPGGRVRHSRRFLPDAAYRAEPAARVVRSADGAAFALLVEDVTGPAGTALTSGSHRLRVRYRRDNRAARPDSHVLSRAGKASDEFVVVDVDV